MNIDIEKLKDQSTSLRGNLQYYEMIGAPVVEEYCKDLDEKVNAIKTYLNNIRTYNLSFDVPSLQKIVIDLSSCIYYTNENYEKLSLLEDMARVRYKDKYNEAYLSKQGASKIENRDYTKDQLKAIADQEAIEEELIHFIYTHAAAVVKGKLDAAEELLKSCSKALSAEIQSMSSFGIGNKHM